MIRVELPAHLRTIARVEEPEVEVEVAGAATAKAVLDALEAKFPALRGTIRDHVTGERRAFLRYFACGLDLSQDSVEKPLPDEVVAGQEPFIVLGAIAGG